jgi:AcrR family transcriptional regulator
VAAPGEQGDRGAGEGNDRAGRQLPRRPSAPRRERKKQLTRDALLAAALELFLAQGYEHTTVREITDAVDVAERTFFRYFAGKEDLTLSFVRDGAGALLEALAARPPAEEPLTALRQAFRESLRQITATRATPATLRPTCRPSSSSNPRRRCSPRTCGTPTTMARP